MSSVEESRRELERRLDDVRGAVGREIGFVPSKLGWLLPVVALSAGVMLALKAKRKKRKRS